MGIGAGAVVAGYTAALVKDDPIRHKEEVYVKMDENAETGFVYFNDATVVGQLRTEEDRRLVEFTEIPQHLIDAFTSTEDHAFFDHPGIDMKGTIRAFKQKILKEDIQTGGSTITQQLARIVFLSLDRTDNRKVKEIFLSLRLERMLSKEEILTAYLNKIPFGNGASGYNVFGVKAAAKGIFDIDDLNKINIAQVAYLAGLPKAPSDYSAFSSKGEFDEKGFTLAEKRQKFVLSEMLAEQKITNEQHEEALNFDLKGSLSKIKPKAYNTYPYLMIEAERKASEILLRLQNPELTLEDLTNADNEELIKEAHNHMLRGGYKIYTTIDKTLYDAMQEIAKNSENFSKDHATKGIEQIGAITINNKTGAILSMMEGRDFYIEQLNHATQMKRQPGSAMKPIGAYIPALELGVIQPGGIIDDIPLILKDGGNGYHIPENWDNKFHGLITARRALNQSYNIPAIKLFTDERIGIATAWDYAKKMGITTLTESDNFAQTGVIGGLEYGVTVEELTNAYSTIANKGVFNDAYMISKIEDAQGNVIYNHESNPTTVFSPETAYLMTDMLRTVITAGTGAEQMKNFKSYKTIPIVGKTGSTQNDHDAWFMGYSPDISTGVWAGYDQPSTLIKGQGTQRAKRIWALIMNAIVEKKPDLFMTPVFEKPANIVEKTVSSLSGKLPNDLTIASKQFVTDLFNKKYLPTEEDNVLVNASFVTYKNIKYIANPETPLEFVQQKTVVKRDQSISELINRIREILPKMKNRPKKSGGALKQAEDYYPIDSGNEAPYELDPRIDDGAKPNPPSVLKLTKSGGFYQLSFNISDSTDVVGYRIYYSLNNGDFRNFDPVVLTGQSPSLRVHYAAFDRQYGYYIEAVDMVGKNSLPSQIVYSEGEVNNPAPTIEPQPTNDPNADPTTESEPEATESEPEAAASSPVGLKAMPGADGVELTWNTNPTNQRILRYNIYIAEASDGDHKNIGSSNTNKFSYTIIPAGGWYRITAVNSLGESEPTSSVEYKQ